MKIWVRQTNEGIPLLHLQAEDKTDMAYLGGIKQQLDEARRDVIKYGLCELSGETCQTEVTPDGFSKLSIRLMLGAIQIVPANDFPPPREDRTRVRLVARRNAGGRRDG